jgi:hypothetical protein
MSRLLCVVLMMLSAGAAHGGPLPVESVPMPLRTWVPWVMQGHETVACPSAYNDPARRECVWPSSLQLELGPRGAGLRLRSKCLPLPAWCKCRGRPTRGHNRCAQTDDRYP